jgi:hypothetical protein
MGTFLTSYKGTFSKSRDTGGRVNTDCPALVPEDSLVEAVGPPQGATSVGRKRSIILALR